MSPLDVTLIADWPFATRLIPGLPHPGSHSPATASSDVPASRPVAGDLKQPSAVGGRSA